MCAERTGGEVASGRSEHLHRVAMGPVRPQRDARLSVWTDDARERVASGAAVRARA